MMYAYSHCILLSCIIGRDLFSLQLESGQYVEYTTAAYESGRQKVCVVVSRGTSVSPTELTVWVLGWWHLLLPDLWLLSLSFFRDYLAVSTLIKLRMCMKKGVCWALPNSLAWSCSLGRTAIRKCTPQLRCQPWPGWRELAPLFTEVEDCWRMLVSGLSVAVHMPVAFPHAGQEVSLLFIALVHVRVLMNTS